MAQLARAVMKDTDRFLEPVHVCQTLSLAAVREARMWHRGEEEVVLELQLDIVPMEAKFQVASIKISDAS